jgi:hypothetical protein
MSQKSAREGLGNPELFQGGVYVTKNGLAELFVQTAEEREAELRERKRTAIKCSFEASHGCKER